MPFGYEYVFPEESLEEVLTMLDIRHSGKLSKAQLFMIRKMLGHGVEKIPDYKDVRTLRYIERRGITIYPIGIKKDARLKKKDWGVEQEML